MSKWTLFAGRREYFAQRTVYVNFLNLSEQCHLGERKLGVSSLHILPSSSGVLRITGDEKSSTTNGLLHVLKELAPWRHEHIYSG
jgi:hypothetical protein